MVDVLVRQALPAEAPSVFDRNTHVATFVERTSRYVHLVRVTPKDTKSLMASLKTLGFRTPAAILAEGVAIDRLNPPLLPRHP
ncbi:hypothetical protein BH11GEM1_BH11GEM1_27740 [soil metagenome]